MQIRQDDELPHIICFRCSAKIEELHDFIRRCIKTQENFEKVLGKKGSYIPKTTSGRVWEKKLTKTNLTNADICDAVIKKAMQGIQGIPPLLPEQFETPNLDIAKETPPKDKGTKNSNREMGPEKARVTRSATEPLLTGITMPHRKVTKRVDQIPVIENLEATDKIEEIKPEPETPKETKPLNTTVEFKITHDEEPLEDKKVFDIMEHVSIIKVNGVGTLFQCSLCNRNFLKKEVVLTHGCSKTGVPRVDFTKGIVKADPPKHPSSSIKYITRVIPEVSNLPKKHRSDTKTISEPDPPVCVEPKSVPNPDAECKNRKSRPGPASKTINVQKHTNIVAPQQSNERRFKLLPGPDNTFTLVEQGTATPDLNSSKIAKKLVVKSEVKNSQINLSSDIIDLDDDVEDNLPAVPTSNSSNTNVMPYPVGLFQTFPSPSVKHPTPAPFTTPAMKKQSYTVIPTSNPSKLLISMKPQVKETPPPEHVKSTSKKRKHPSDNQDAKFNISLQNVDHSKGVPSDGFFSFINVDPLLQPSYVLPTSNIQEPRISTSTLQASSSKDSKENYNCSLCPQKFNREKKLLTHIQWHYDKGEDEEVQDAPKNSRKRSRTK